MNDRYDLGDDDMEFFNVMIEEWFKYMNAQDGNALAGYNHLVTADNLDKVREMMLNIEIYNSPEDASAVAFENAQIEVDYLTDDFLRGVLAGFIVLLDHERYATDGPEMLAGLAYLHIAAIVHERTGVRP